MESLDVLHVDMDCFFAAVEILDAPSLSGKPVIVGGTGPRGVVASCSYEARAFGVRSAMPMGEARRRCPHAVVVGGRHHRYGEVSVQLHEVFREFTPVIEPISLDEAFLDVSGSHRLFGTSEEIGQAIRARVRERLELDCAVGVGRSKLIAKLASREAKPRPSRSGPVPGRGVVVVRASEELGFLHPRLVRELWGVGPKTAERLARYGMATIGDLAATDRGALERVVGRVAGAHLHDLSWGRDDRPVEPGLPVKSVGHEETFSTDRHAHSELRPEVLRLADSVGSRLRGAGLTGRTVTLKLRFGDFTTITRAHSLPGPLLSGNEIGRIASALLEAVDVGPGVRLVGVSVSSLESRDSAGARQLSLVDVDDLSGPEQEVGGEAGRASRRRPSEPARAEVEAAVDAIRGRYGSQAVGPAAAAEAGKGLRVKQLGDHQWG
jgi:DNA polymerase-4